MSGSGFGEFVIGPNKDRDTVYIVDEVSLIGIDNDDLQQNPVLVQFKISSTKYYERMSDPLQYGFAQCL